MTAVAEGTAATTAAATPGEAALEKATKWANEYAARLTVRAEQRLAELAGHSNGNGMLPRIGGPPAREPGARFFGGFGGGAGPPVPFGGPPPDAPRQGIAPGGRAVLAR